MLKILLMILLKGILISQKHNHGIVSVVYQDVFMFLIKRFGIHGIVKIRNAIIYITNAKNKPRDKMTDYTKPQPCGECGAMVMIDERPTYEDCLRCKKYTRKR